MQVHTEQGVRLAKVREITDPEISGDTINAIHCLSLDRVRSSILVHTRDNCIRRLQYEKGRVSIIDLDHRTIFRRQFL